MIKNMLSIKIKQKLGANKAAANESFFVFAGNNMPNGCNFMFSLLRINDAANIR